MQRINSQVMRSSNLQLILHTVRRHGPISRTDLTERIGLTPASVIKITNALMDSGVLNQVGLNSNACQGRKALMLDVNADAWYVIGAEMNTEHIAVGIGDFRCGFKAYVQTPICVADGVESMISTLVQTVETAILRAGVPRSKILGMGLAAPGPLNAAAGVLINPPNFPGWKNVPIARMLEERLGFPICCDRESNAAAMAEYTHGAAEGCKSVFLISLFRLGVGGGMVADGAVFRGYRDGAGEIGHMAVDPDGPRCTCGSYGCLETMVSGEALLKRVQHAYKMRAGICPFDAESLRLEDVFRLCEEGDEVCTYAVQRAASYIAVALGNVINLFSPELIVLGGTLPLMSAKLVKQVRAQIRAKKYPSHCKDIRVVSSAFGEQAAVKGAMVLAINQFLPEVIARHTTIA